MVERIGCHLVVRVQTHFTPCNTISYACKHVLHLAIRFRMHANTFCTLQHDFVCVQTRFAPCNTISYACKHVLRLAIRFRMCANTFYIVATTDLGVNMTVTSLQQTIRGSIWPLHRCSNWFGGRNDRYIVAARHNSYVTYGYVAGSIKFASIPTILPANAPTSLTFLQSCRQKRHER